MVFLSSPFWRRITHVVKTPNPDRFWKRRKVLTMSAHFRGRKQNCYTLAVQHVRRALRRSTFSRKLKLKDEYELQTARLTAACEEHGLGYKYFREGLTRSNVLLTKRVLTDLAIWEPRTFKCLVDFSWNKCKSEGLKDIKNLGDPPSGVILRPMVIK